VENVTQNGAANKEQQPLNMAVKRSVTLKHLKRNGRELPA